MSFLRAQGLLRPGKCEQSLLTSRHPSVTDPVDPDLVSYFALPGGIFTSLAPGGFSKTPW